MKQGGSHPLNAVQWIRDARKKLIWSQTDLESFDEKKNDFLDSYRVSGKASVTSPSISVVTLSNSNTLSQLEPHSFKTLKGCH